MPELSLSEFVIDALHRSRHIKDFCYWGILDLGTTWAFTFSKNRDSSLAEISNFDVIHADLLEMFPDDVELVHASHWACGWIDHLAVRMLLDTTELTGAAERIFEWTTQLEEYPVADDLDLGRREHEAALERLPLYIKGKLRDYAPDDWRQQVLARMNYTEVLDDFSLRFSHDPTVVATELGFIDDERGK